MVLDITTRINECMAEAELRPTELSKLVGVSKQTVTGWTKGRITNIRPENLVSLADALGVEIRWLATGRGPKHPPPSLPHDVQDVASALAKMSPETRAAFFTIVRNQAA